MGKSFPVTAGAAACTTTYKLLRTDHSTDGCPAFGKCN